MLGRLHDAVPQLFADQVEFHAQLGADRLLEAARARDVLVTAYSPLGNGKGLIEADAVQEVAAARGATPAQVAIAYLARQDDVTVLPRSTNPDRRRENLAALEVDLTAEDDAHALQRWGAVRRHAVRRGGPRGRGRPRGRRRHRSGR